MLEALADVFMQNFSTIGFLIFEETKLRTQISAFPKALLWAFLGVVVRFSDHPFFRGVAESAISFYSNATRRMVLAEISVPTRSVEMLQALCLNCYSDILGQYNSSTVSAIIY